MSSQDSKGSLEKYRAEIHEITKSILDQILERQKLAETIAEVKAISGFAVEDHKIEDKLNAEMLKYARDSGLDSELAGKIVAELIEHSKIAQRKKIHLPAIREHLLSSRIECVSILGAGRMGGWFARYFIEAGARVLVFDKNSTIGKNKAKELNCEFTNDFRNAASSDLLVVAVPITSTPTLLLELAKVRSSDTKDRTRIMEISSVKSGISKIDPKIFRNVRFCSIHPLFGPTANPFAENSMVLIGRESAFVSNVFPHYRIFRMKTKEHDRLMATMLTEPHVHALSFADTVIGKKIPSDIHSPSFDYLLELSKRVLRESEQVYYEIQAANPFAAKALDETLSSMRKLQKLYRNRTAFKKFFNVTRRKLGQRASALQQEASP